MSGATAEPWLITINAPNKANIRRIGISQNFFLTRIKFQSSLINDMTQPPKIDFSLNLMALFAQSNMTQHFYLAFA